MKSIKLFVALFFVSFLFQACQNNKQEVVETPKLDSLNKETSFEMYKMTELAMLMEQMYSYNLHLRSRILDKESLGDYPERFNKIHTAVMTDPSENDLFFQQQATLFIEAQKAIYANPEQATEKFNNMVQSCLNCHAKKCGGPIPRIKKLLIN